ncbi:molybdopterin cofactor-binding domain-containing protein [uncultured Hydrogenophaga sp.]|uniref:xanthine dehydrogenase family protein molybdopterin-binding subunit n=1 Tax=uncultured Hydrogenophaga sp. TaxID=199683 RepID=UPI002D1E42D6|nr:molybdopterin cofactor-binding domain-containing protein [uncultured Hydrogenophaga sp.]
MAACCASGTLAAEAAQRPVPSRPRLKTPEQFRLIGRPTPRLDAAAKTDGSARFGIDVQQVGLLHAAVQFCPTRLGRVQACDEAPARARPRREGGAAAPTPEWRQRRHGRGGRQLWQARQAVEACRCNGITARWPLRQRHRARGLSTLLDQEEGFAFHREGDLDAALAGAARRIEAEYRAPWLAHSTLEPMNCTVQLAADGRSATVWAPTQVPGLARRAAAQVLGLDTDAVTVHVTLLGGGFGRRLDVDFVAQAAAVARAVPGRPVRTLWTREQDMRHDFYRPACVARFSAGLDATGQLVAWKNTSAGQAIVPQVLQRVFGLPGGGPDKTTSEGAFDQPYEWPAARIAHVNADLPLPVGFWRAVGHSHQAFFKECFLDEVAHAAGTDPLVLRESLLQQHPRELAVLQAAARAAGWGTPAAAAPDGAAVARGLALHRSFGSTVAQVAEVSLGPDRGIRVHRVVCAIDCGFAVNPAGVKQQMESGIVFGLSAALYGQVDIRNGQVQPGNFHEQPVLRLTDMPAIEVLVMPSHHSPEGVGEPGLPPLAPAVANAVFALTGQRLRSLPLKLA